MKILYFAYDVNGRVTNSFAAEEGLTLDGVIESNVVYAPNEIYIDSGAITVRQKMSLSADKTNVAADGVDVVTISGVPAGAEVTSSGFSASCDGTDITFSTDIKGDHVLLFSLFPYLDTEVAINGI